MATSVTKKLQGKMTEIGNQEKKSAIIKVTDFNMLLNISFLFLDQIMHSWAQFNSVSLS